MDQAVRGYVDGIAVDHRKLFDRLHRLIIEACPNADVVLSYGIPTYRSGKRRLYVGAWQHGLSIYGWRQAGDGGFTSRHPALSKGKATIQLRPEDAADISDDELRGLARAVLVA